jgi:hypothetical protein
MPDEFTDEQLIGALETLRKDAELRRNLGARARRLVVEQHNVRGSAAQYFSAIERFAAASTIGIRSLSLSIAKLGSVLDNRELAGIAQAVAMNMPDKYTVPQLLLDVSAIRCSKPETEIERASRSLVLTLLKNPADGFRIEPIYLSDQGGVWHYRYARQFSFGLLGCPDVVPEDVVEPKSGDVLLVLDDFGRLAEKERLDVLAEYRRHGVTVYSIIYDLLPLQLPRRFPSDAIERYEIWLRAVLRMDGAVCVSRTVADELRESVERYDLSHRQPFRVGWFPLGADASERTAHPKSEGIPWMTWEESAQRLKEVLLRGEWYASVSGRA